ncbi:hypothetical protein B0O99DRAFT_653146 [Bisporella sp. PMI_857]|nr:hypothetical protein B0O99DRAFT_653146 [Bisporella sp. PMI_857]
MQPAVSLRWSYFDIDGEWSKTLERDVCVAGEGAGGTHAAVSLIDLNKTVVVIERNDYLGGHTNTYFNVSLLNMSSVKVNEAGQPPKKAVPALLYNTVPYYLDFRNDEAVTDAFQRFAKVLSTYSYLLDGYGLPDPVPEDLNTPFGVFLEKYNLTAEWAACSTYLLSTIYVIKYYNLDDLIYGAQGYLAEANGNNSRIYTKAREYVGSDNLLLESTVIAANQDFAVFSQYSKANGYWTGLVRSVGLNQTVSYYNRATNSPSNIPALPGLYSLGPVGIIDDVWYIKFGPENPSMTDAQVQLYVESEIKTIQQANSPSLTKPEWLIFESHSPFFLQVSPEVIQNHFFADLTALQGALHPQYSTLLWRFNQDVVIPKMLRSD